MQSHRALFILFIFNWIFHCTAKCEYVSNGNGKINLYLVDVCLLDSKSKCCNCNLWIENCFNSSATHTHKWMLDDVVCQFHRWIITLMTYRVSLGHSRCILQIYKCCYILVYEYIWSDCDHKLTLSYLEI